MISNVMDLYEALIQIPEVSPELVDFVRHEINKDEELMGWNGIQPNEEVITPHQAIFLCVRKGNLTYARWLLSNFYIFI